MADKWTGRAVIKARAVVATWLPAPCGICTQPVTTDQSWVVGHKIPRWMRPDLTFVMTNWQPEHRDCSDKTGPAEARARAAHERSNASIFPNANDTAEAFVAAVSLPEEPTLDPTADALFAVPPSWGPAAQTAANAARVFPVKGGLIEPRPELRWDPDRLRTYPWLVDLADVPEDASPPYAMSLPPEEAVCSYGWSGCTHMPDGDTTSTAVEWIEAQAIRGVRVLRWWQRLKIVRKLEHRADGSLVHFNVLSSGPRRIGKSVAIRGATVWRMEFGQALFGEVQTIIHTGSDVAICREIQRGAWGWAHEHWGKDSVKTANGKEALESPNDDRWLVKAQDAVYGYDVCEGLGDECWDVKPDTVTEGLEPAALERASAQIDLTSTAHRRATSLMRTALLDALTIEDPETLVLLWAAGPGVDLTNLAGVLAAARAASPHWSADRARLIARKYEKAAAGEQDPEFDDPDPMAGFCAQYLNVWALRERRAQRGTPLVDPDTWDELTGERPVGLPHAIAVEGWPGAGASVALAWRVGGRVLVDATDHPDLTSAVAAVKATGYRGQTLVGKALTDDPALRRLRRVPASDRTAAAVADLADRLAEDTVRHAGSTHLTNQIIAVRTLDGTDGLRMASTGRADAVKAAAWAIERARTHRASNRRIVLPNTG
jgi:hypothetical protein